MPIGIIIIAVVSVVTFILAKCCGIKIDPIGKTKKALNDLRDRWKWLDLNLNRIKCCYRVRELPDNKTTLFVENDAFDNLSVSIEPYSQPVIRPRASFKNTYSYRPSISSITESIEDLVPKRERPKSLALSRVRYISATTVTPISIDGSILTTFDEPNEDLTPIMVPQSPIIRRGTDFNRIV